MIIIIIKFLLQNYCESRRSLEPHRNFADGAKLVQSSWSCFVFQLSPATSGAEHQIDLIVIKNGR